jgi:hypothetical protein
MIDGAGSVEVNGCEPVQFSKGDAVVVPASFPQFRIQPLGTVQFLKSYVPGVPVPEPVVVI